MNVGAEPLTEARARELATHFSIDLSLVGGIEWWVYGVETEMANLHFALTAASSGLHLDSATPLDELAARVAIRKLQLYRDWYQRLKRTEDAAIKYWRQMK